MQLAYHQHSASSKFPTANTSTNGNGRSALWKAIADIREGSRGVRGHLGSFAHEMVMYSPIAVNEVSGSSIAVEWGVLGARQGL